MRVRFCESQLTIISPKCLFGSRLGAAPKEEMPLFGPLYKSYPIPCPLGKACERQNGGGPRYHI